MTISSLKWKKDILFGKLKYIQETEVNFPTFGSFRLFSFIVIYRRKETTLFSTLTFYYYTMYSFKI